MSRRESGKVFIGRLNRNIRREEVEDAFETYGRIIRCDIKSGSLLLINILPIFNNYTLSIFQNGGYLCN